MKDEINKLLEYIPCEIYAESAWTRRLGKATLPLRLIAIHLRIDGVSSRESFLSELRFCTIAVGFTIKDIVARCTSRNEYLPTLARVQSEFARAAKVIAKTGTTRRQRIMITHDLGPAGLDIPGIFEH